jgi:hypothetical protein
MYIPMLHCCSANVLTGHMQVAAYLCLQEAGLSWCVPVGPHANLSCGMASES